MPVVGTKESIGFVCTLLTWLELGSLRGATGFNGVLKPLGRRELGITGELWRFDRRRGDGCNSNSETTRDGSVEGVGGTGCSETFGFVSTAGVCLDFPLSKEI